MSGSEIQESNQSRRRLSLPPENGASARCFGVVAAVRASKLIVFFDVLHATGSIQVAADRERFSDEDWKAIRSIRKGQRIKADGIVGESRTGQQTLFLSVLPLFGERLMADTLADTHPDYHSVGARILTATMRSLAEAFFEQHNYLRIDPRYISASWPPDSFPLPLQVKYPGFGVPVYLASSPSEQLVDAIVASGEDRVFCSGTSFTTSYRQPSDGVETAIVLAKTLHMEFESLIEEGHKLIVQVITQACGLAKSREYREWTHIEKPWPSVLPLDTPSTHEIWTYRADPPGLRLFRVAFRTGEMPVEGSVERVGRGIAVGTLAFHPERILSLVQHAPIRRLQHLGAVPYKRRNA